jgi:(E)-4-hydroxy-3-methylbut-2-enyl-diphosphate synthase
VNVIACPSCARQQFDVIRTVEALEDRLKHITTPMTVSVIGCVVNGPGEARETDIGLTGGGQGKHMVYVGGVPQEKTTTAEMLDKLVAMIEEKAAKIEAAKATEAEKPADAAPRLSASS